MAIGAVRQVNYPQGRLKKAMLLTHSESPRYVLTREKGGFIMKSNPIRFKLDNRAFFESIGLKSIDTLAQELINEGKKAAYESTERYCVEGEMYVKQGADATYDIALMRTQTSIDSMLVFIPERPPELSWEGGTIDIEYTPDRLRFEWQTHKVEMEYVPYESPIFKG